MDAITLGTALSAVITGTSEALGGELWKQIVSLIRQPKQHVAAADSQGTISPGEPELAALQQSPHDQEKAIALAEVLLSRARADVSFERTLHTWWVHAEPFRAGAGSVTNIISGGTQHGPVVQGKNFGSLTFGAPAPARGAAGTDDRVSMEENRAVTAGAPREADNIHNDFRGEAHGPMVQADTINGGVNFHATPQFAPIVPRQLPTLPGHFTGRLKELESLTRFLDDVVADGETVVISAINGAAGIGKTALAVHWAHRNADRFPDGQLFINLRGFDPAGVPLDADDAIQTLLEALIPPERIPRTAEERISLYRSLLSERRMLVLLDNARDARQIRPLLPSGSSCLALVTSRSRMTGLVADPGARPLVLGLLRDDDAMAMLTRVIGPARIAAEPAAVDDLIQSCNGLPLALAIVAATAATSPGDPLQVIADQVRDEQQRLDILETADLGKVDKSVRAVISWSYSILDNQAQHVFRLLGAIQSQDVDVCAAASLVGEPARAVRRTLAVLTHVHLLDSRVTDRYEMHDLVRAYAAERAEAEDSPSDRLAGVSRLLDFYLHTAHAAARQLGRYREPPPLDPPAAGVERLSITDYPQAMTWFIAEHATLATALDQAFAMGFDGHVWRLAWTLNDYYHRRGYWEEIVVTQQKALDAASRLGDDAGAATAHWLTGRAETRLHRFDSALFHQNRALELWERLGNRAGQAHAHLGLGQIAEEDGRHADAVTHAGRALGLFRAAGHMPGQARSLNGLAWNHGLLGHYDIAIRLAEEGLLIQRQLGDRHGEADTLDTLGYAKLHQRDLTDSIRVYGQALILWHDLGDDYSGAMTRIQMGDAHLTLGHRDAARHEWRKALAVFERMQHHESKTVRARLKKLDEDEEFLPLPSIADGESA